MKIISKRSHSASSEKDIFYPSQPNKATLDSKPNLSPHKKEAINRAADVGRDTGALDNAENVPSHSANQGKLGIKLQISEQTLCEHKFNISVREAIFSALLSIFLQYDKFVIVPSLDENGHCTNSNDTQDNFDKTSFLSDQPEFRLPFLLPFLDTQMFASFIDSSVVFHQREVFTKDPNLQLFDDRIEQSKVPFETRSPTTPDIPAAMNHTFRTISVSSNTIATTYYETWTKEAESLVERRFSKVDVMTGLPQAFHKLSDQNVVQDHIEQPYDTFPVIRAKLLEPQASENTKKHLRRRNTSNRTSLKRQLSYTEQRLKKLPALLRQPSMSEYSPEIIARTNWMFVGKLLKDIKQKTKKILVGKMGKEAVELGHGELSDSLSNLEENTWIASLCDLIERIWSHGLLTNYKKGKSALWSHLLQYQVEEDEKSRKKKMMPHFGGSSPSLLDNDLTEASPADEPFDPSTSYYSLPRSFPRKNSSNSPRKRNGSEARQSASENNSSNVSSIPQMSFTLLQSIERIQSMREIQTDVGRSRAWVRLALERKQLSTYMKKLLCNHHLLDYMYKKYSFLQCDDEREQFLYHILSLAAADFTCFTNSFTKTTFEYYVWIVPGKQYQFAMASQTTANVYISINGELNTTEKISLPRGCTEFSFKHRNLGVITTLAIGHDNAGRLPKWLVDCVIVQNRDTGQWKMKCAVMRLYADVLCSIIQFYAGIMCTIKQLYPGIGKGVDDNSLERLLVPEVIPRNEDIIKFANRLVQQNSKANNCSIAELHEKAGQAVNSLVKYYYKSERERRLDVSPPPAAFTKLLYSLVVALESIFTHGLKPGGIFKRRRLFALDIIAVCSEAFQESSPTSLTLFPERTVSTPAPPEPTHITAGGDWFLGSRRTSAITTTAQQRLRDLSGTSRSDMNGGVRSEAALAQERKAFARLCQLYQQISSSTDRLGKDDVFHLLMMIGIHEQTLALWLPRICDVAKTADNLYEEHAFFLNKDAVIFLSQVLHLLVENEVPLDRSLLRGFDSLIRM